ncbi:MAG: DNA modification methylase [Planctomycetes bacterium]|nr:DNA modification methylase [Planctomycetota bacterium]
MLVQTIPITRINPAPYNPRRDLQPGDPEYEKLAKSMDEFGCVEPLVWNRRTGHLVGGHQRLKILKAQGETDLQVSVVDLPLDREKALNIALNKISGDWDEHKLAELLQEMVQTPELDVELTGFELGEAEDLIAEILDDGRSGQPETFDVDAALDAAGPWVTQPGDLILLGRDPDRQHRLLCGDATDAESVRGLMEGRRATLFATDPPYLVGYDGTNHPGSKRGRGRGGRGGRGGGRGGERKSWSASYGATWDDNDGDPALYENFCRVAVNEAIREDAAWYCWHASRRQAMLESVWNGCGAFVHCQIIWVKNKGVPTRTWYLWRHEPCFMGWLKGHTPPRADQSRRSTVWEIDTIPNGRERPDHPTPKPLEVFEIPMLQHTKRGEICYEPFAGSGTQFIAAERLGRRCFGVEISPRYCDLIVRRYIAFAGESSVDPEIARRYRITEQEDAA